MVKEGYKEVRVGPQKEIIPDNWNVKALSDIGKFINGKGFSSSDWEEEGLPIVRIQNLNDEEAEYNYYSGDVKDRYYLEDGDILLSWSASLGAYKWNRGNAILNQHIFKVLPKDNIDKEFMYQLLLVTIDKLEQKTHGSTMKHIRRKELDLTYFPLPPLPEQKKISSILSSVDKSIEKTDEVIEETKELKKGLMQELLTKGIGHSEFKDSQFGEIPKSWEINVMSYAAKINPRYKIPEKDEFLFLEMDSVNEHSPEVDGYEKREKSRCTNVKFKKGDVLFARITPSTENGKTALIENLEEKIAFGSTELIVLSPKKDLITSDYIYYLLKWSEVRNLAISMMEGSTGRQRVPREVFDGAIKIPLPPLEEQKKISSILSSVDTKIKKEEEYKAKLERLKKGLMQKLLTGEIRVNTEMEV